MESLKGALEFYLNDSVNRAFLVNGTWREWKNFFSLGII
jgi:hypothetical protein